jgi:PhzF family phenazine biosynthesis protein
MRMFQVDAFTGQAFTGNPAAVCLLDRDADDEWLQRVAMEMNLSETAFVRLGNPGQPVGLRWFTPVTEVALCGHAALATAHILFEEGLAGREPIRFSTKSGILTAERSADAIELDFPASSLQPAEAPAGLVEAIGVVPRAVLRSPFDLLVELGSAQEIRGLRPDLTRLATLPARGLIVTARGDGEYDFVSRFFAPAVGIPEDPVTGSAHCALAPFWAERLGKRAMTALQVSHRGGVVRVRLEGGRVRLGGQAVTVLRGELVIPPAPGSTQFAAAAADRRTPA